MQIAVLLKFTPIIFVTIFDFLPKKLIFLVRIGRPHFDCIAIYNVSDSPNGAKRSLCRYLLCFRHDFFLVGFLISLLEFPSLFVVYIVCVQFSGLSAPVKPCN